MLCEVGWDWGGVGGVDGMRRGGHGIGWNGIGLGWGGMGWAGLEKLGECKHYVLQTPPWFGDTYSQPLPF